jgi:hypothetical protein
MFSFVEKKNIANQIYTPQSWGKKYRSQATGCSGSSYCSTVYIFNSCLFKIINDLATVMNNAKTKFYYV